MKFSVHFNKISGLERWELDRYVSMLQQKLSGVNKILKIVLIYWLEFSDGAVLFQYL